MTLLGGDDDAFELSTYFEIDRKGWEKVMIEWKAKLLYFLIFFISINKTYEKWMDGKDEKLFNNVTFPDQIAAFHSISNQKDL